MKTFIIFLLGLCAQFAFGQAEVIEQSFPFKGQKLDLDLNFGSDVVIKAWDKNEISVKITYEINEGKDNSLMNWKIDDNTDRLNVDIEINTKKLEKMDNCWCSKKGNIYWNSDRKGNSVCVDIKVEISMPSKANMKIKTIVADVAVEGIVGDIDLETVTGEINLLWLQDSGAAIEIETTMGAIYTNTDLVTQQKGGLPQISSHHIEGAYKNGGYDLRLKTVTGDIYFRKTER
jgi:hypothetical protein